MNWPRIRIGAFLAGIVLWVADLLVLNRNVFATAEPLKTFLLEAKSAAVYLFLPELVVGFILCWLYVLARPRLGPGPLTAIIMGSIAFVLSHPYLLDFPMWLTAPKVAGFQAVIGWLKFVAATYVAGWQYIERAP